MGVPVPPATRDGVQYMNNAARTSTPRQSSAPNRGVLHMTDVVLNPAVHARTHPNPPHEWWDRRTPGQVWGSCPLNHAARALLGVSGMETNHRGYCYQLEINDRAGTGAAYNDATLEQLARDVIVPISELFGLPYVAYADGVGSAAGYGIYASSRMTTAQWMDATKGNGSRWGWCLHQNVPRNSHWDGPIAMTRLMDIAAEISGDFDMATGLDFVEEGDGAEPGEDRHRVRYWQRVLSRLGHYTGPIDGVYGPAMVAAVRLVKPEDFDGTRVGNKQAYWIHRRWMSAEAAVAVADALDDLGPPPLTPHVHQSTVGAAIPAPIGDDGALGV